MATIIEALTGHPAFPLPAGRIIGEGRTAGLSVRDYFAARAPHEPAAWFQPTMSTRRPAAIWHAGHDAPDHWCDDLPENWKQQAAWDEDRRRQRIAQWPWAWADLVLAARTREA